MRMHSTFIAWLAAVAFLYVSGTLLSRRLRDRHAAEWMHLTRESLGEHEPLTGPVDMMDPQAIRAIRAEAEAAALAAAFGGTPAAGNRHAPGTRAHILWVTSFHARLIYLTERREARRSDLGATIGRIRAEGALRSLAVG
jgi:hypothetical protein